MVADISKVLNPTGDSDLSDRDPDVRPTRSLYMSNHYMSFQTAIQIIRIINRGCLLKFAAPLMKICFHGHYVK